MFQNMVGEDMLKDFHPIESLLLLSFCCIEDEWAISVGYETYDAWLAISDRVVAFIFSANVCWTSGGI